MMQKSYPNSTLIQALLFAPLPLFICGTIYLISQPSFLENYNGYSNLANLIRILIGIYLIYIFIISPFLFALLYLLNRSKRIHFLVLTCFAYFSAIVLSTLANYLKNHELPNTLFELKKLFIFNGYLILTGGTILGFWLFLKWQDYRNHLNLTS